MDATAQDLRRIPLLADLPVEDLEALAREGRPVSCAANQLILSQGEPTRDVFFIVRGHVRVTAYAASGREVSYRDLGAGDMFGELAAIDGQARSATVIAMEDSALIRVSAGAFCTALQRNAPLANAVLRSMVGLIRALSHRVFEFSTLDVRQRLHAELLRLARQQGVRTGRGITIRSSPKHAELASRVSTHREAISREMSALTRARIIERSGPALIIRDVNRLSQLLADEMGD